MKKLICILPAMMLILAFSACTKTEYTEEERQTLIDQGTPLIEAYLESVPGAERTTDINATIDVTNGRARLTGDVDCRYEVDGLEYVVSINVETGEILVWDGYRAPEDNAGDDNPGDRAAAPAVPASADTAEDAETRPETPHKTPEEQIDLFLEQMDAWYQGGSPDYYPAYLCYAVTDLNQNGRLEIISSEFRYDTNVSINRFFEIDEAETGVVEMDYDLANADDTDIAPGLVNAELPTLCFFGDGAYHYSLPTPGQPNENLEIELFYILSINQQGEISTELLAQKWVSHTTGTTSYLSGLGEIERREYDGADLIRYDGYDLCECGWSWVMLPEGWGQQEFRSELMDSWEQFAFDILGFYK